MPEDRWLSCSEFAALVGITDRKARAALRRCHTGAAWRGQILQTLRITGKGGAGGLSYRVSLESLPPELQARHREGLGGAEAAATAPLGSVAALPAYAPPQAIHWNEGADARLASFQKVAGETLELTPERKQMIDAEAARLGISVSTYRASFKRYQDEGVAGAARKARSDQRKPRVALSREWGACAERMGIAAEEKAKIAEEALQRIKAEWRSGGPKQPWTQVQAKVMGWLVMRCKDAATATPDAVSDDELREDCLLPPALIRRSDLRKYQALAIAERDAGRASATQCGRIRCDWSHLKPMAKISADVHPSDTLVLREDGSTATARVVSWLDKPTGRLRMDPFLLEKGEGLKTCHVLESFAALCANPSWGLPTAIYTDNGSEYKSWSEQIEPLGKIKVDLYCGDGVRPGMTHARAYQPQSKAIEHVFAILERILADTPGHIGSNRMNKKCERQGKPLPPIPFAQFQEQLAVAVEFYNNREQPRSLTLKGKSPNQAFAEHLAAGWKSHTMTQEELVPYLCKPIGDGKAGTRVVQAGGKFSVGVPYYADALQSLGGGGHRVLVKRPLFGDQRRLLVYAADTLEFLCVADPEPTYRHDADGLAEAARREKEGKGALLKMKKDTDTLDQVASYRAVNAAYGQPPVGDASNVVLLAPKNRAIAEALKAPRARPAADDPDAVRIGSASNDELHAFIKSLLPPHLLRG